MKSNESAKSFFAKAWPFQGKNSWAIKWIIKDLLFYKSFSISLILSLAFGILGFCLLEISKDSFQSNVSARSKNLLGADLAVWSRSPLRSEQLKQLEIKFADYIVKKSKSIEMYSMLQGPKNSRLVQVVAIESPYPMHGQYTLQLPPNYKGEANASLFAAANMWVYPEVLHQLSMELNDKASSPDQSSKSPESSAEKLQAKLQSNSQSSSQTNTNSNVKLGNTTFSINNVVLDDSAIPLGRSSLAPRVYIDLKQLESTELLQKGSTAFYNYYFNFNELKSVEELKLLIAKEINDPMFKVSTAQDASEMSARLIAYLNDYLGLVACVAMLLAFMACFYLMYSHIKMRTKDMAILSSLGRSSSQISNLYRAELLFLSLFSYALCMCLLLLSGPVFKSIVQELIPMQLSFTISWQSFLYSLSVVCIFPQLLVIPIFNKIKNQSDYSLLREESFELSSSVKLMTWKERFCKISLYFPLVVFLILFIFVQAKSIKIGSIFILSLISISLVLSIAYSLCLKLLFVRRFQLSFLFRHLVLILERQKAVSFLILISTGISVALLVLVFQLQIMLTKELSFEATENSPSLFLFDIQEEQAESLQNFLQEQNFNLQNLSPIVRATLTHINSVAVDSFEKSQIRTREQEQEDRSKSRTYNLSEREFLSSSERIIKGRHFNSVYNEDQEMVESTIEKRFAQRLGVDVGDILEFEILGISVKTKIVGIRVVKWISFEPNFFIQFQKGFFADAPKTYIASIAKLNSDSVMHVQQKVVDQFPNISMIDVRRALDKILQISSQVLMAVSFMAFLVLFAAISLLFSILRFDLKMASKTAFLFEILGKGQKFWFQLQFFRYLLLSSLAIVLGSALGFVAAKIVFAQVFMS